MNRSTATDSLWSLVALGTRALASLVTFVVLTRSLGDEQFGFYIGVVALAGIAKPLSMAGAPDLLARNVSRDSADFARALRRVVSVASTIGVAALVILIAVGAVVIDQLDIVALALLAFAELLSYAVPETVAKALNSLERFRDGAIVLLSLGIGRAAIAGILAVAGVDTIAPFAAGFVVVTVVVSIGSWGALPPERVTDRQPLLSAEGAAFAGSHVSATIQNDVDKSMLVAISGGAEAGAYGAGYRLVQYSLLPVQSLLAATYPRFFQRGVEGAAGTRSYARRLVPMVLAYTIPVGMVLILAAGLLARIVGGSFESVDLVIISMAGFPAMFALQTVFGDALVGSGHERFRATAAAGTAALNIALNVILLPTYGWRGAVVATYVVEFLLLTASYLRLRVAVRASLAGHEVNGEVLT